LLQPAQIRGALMALAVLATSLVVASTPAGAAPSAPPTTAPDAQTAARLATDSGVRV